MSAFGIATCKNPVGNGYIGLVLRKKNGADDKHF